MPSTRGASEPVHAKALATECESMAASPLETQLIRAFEATSEVRLLLDLHGLVLAVTDGYVDTASCSRSQVLGKHLADVPPYAACRAIQAPLGTHLRHVVDAMAAMPLSTVELPSNALGTTWTRAFSEPIRDRAGDSLQSIVHTLFTTEVSVEPGLAERERRLRKLIEHSNDGIALYGPKGKCLFVSPSVTRLLGYSEEEFLVRLDIVHPDDRVPFARAIRELRLQPGAAIQLRMRVQHKDRSWRTHEVAFWNMTHDPDVQALVSHFHDVTEYVELENHLKQTNDQLLLALQAARAMTWSFRSVGPGAVELVSGDFAGFFGVSPAAVREYGAVASVHPDDREKVVVAYAAAFKTGVEFTLEFRGAPNTPAENRYYVAHGRFARQPNLAGEDGLLVGVTWDVTEHQRMLQERAELDRHLRESQKLESLGVLAGGIAHDFNNLLTIVLGNACIAQRQVEPMSTLAEQLRSIDEAARRASELCFQMLAYAGRGKFALAPVSLNRLVEESTLLQVSLLKKIALRFVLTPELPCVVADQTQLRQVLINLVVNAAEAIGNKPGTITVATGIVRGESGLSERALVAPHRLAEGYVYLEVVDNGPGMDDATLARIFEPFFTTKFTGRGLGLSAVLGIVRGHGGVLKVQSTPGAGARFLMALPLHDGALELRAPGVSMPPRAELQGTVLLVDDDPHVLSVTQTMLDSMGLRVIPARDGREAVDLCLSHKGQVSVVLMDLTMPTLDGAEALKELRGLGVSVPVLLMSGYSEQETRSRLLGYEPYTFLQKPFGPAELRDRLIELMCVAQPDIQVTA
jgi:PAS domain S-box-containing protein